MPLPAQSKLHFGFQLQFLLIQISVWRDKCLKRINASAAGVAYSWPAYNSPSSKDVTEVEYATEWYDLESPGRQSLLPVTKKRDRYQVEADMSEMSSMSELRSML
jgi:hypothetical protein